MAETLKISAEVDEEKVDLILEPFEVEAGLSVCTINAIDAVFCLKGPSGHAMWFSEERNAMATQDQEKFEYLFTIAAKDLDEWCKKQKIGPYTGDNGQIEAPKSTGTKKPPKL